MKKLSVLLVLCIGFALVTKSQGIQFYKDIEFKEALSKASAEGKLLFVDCYTTWCGPCTYLTKNIFTQQSVGDFYNKNFINLKVDMEANLNGPAINSRVQIRAYPTLLFFNAN